MTVRVGRPRVWAQVVRLGSRVAALVPWAVVLVVAALGAGPAVARAQRPADWDPGRLHMTREGLEALLQRFEESTRSAAYSEDLKARARYEASLIRKRLEEGDFQVGDQIALYVEGEQALTDTFTVAEGRVLVLPVVGEIPLRGVLRSELEAHLTRELGRYIRQPVVRARSLIRISILGEVGRPGFYVVPSEALVTDALMLAGGPTGNAKLTSIYVERRGERIWAGAPLQQAIIEGRTLDQLSLQAGDQIVVPSAASGARGEWIRWALISLPGLVLALAQVF